MIPTMKPEAAHRMAERLERRNLAPLRDAPWDRMPQDLVKDMGSIHVNPSAGGDYRRELNAPLGALGQVVAAHNTQSRLVWSYFYDAPQRWRWVYPAQSRDEVFAATGKSDMGTALAVFWEAQGARPIEAAGPTRNPLNLDHTPGGSSSGSAAAVAAGMVDFALGTQTGGSMMRPAAFTGILGFKPSFGAVHRSGLFLLCDSLDTIGYFPVDLGTLAVGGRLSELPFGALSATQFVKI